MKKFLQKGQTHPQSITDEIGWDTFEHSQVCIVDGTAVTTSLEIETVSKIDWLCKQGFSQAEIATMTHYREDVIALAISLKPF